MQTIEQVVDAVQEHWVLSGVEPKTADEMADELADHLRLAEAEGKSAEVVVGGDLRSFADDWARPVGSRDMLVDRLELMAIAVAVYVIFSVGANAIFERGDVVVSPISLSVFTVVAVVLSLFVLSPTTSRLRSNMTLRKRSLVPLVSGFSFALFGVSWWAVTETFEDPFSFTVPRWLAIGTFVATFLVLVVATFRASRGRAV